MNMIDRAAAVLLAADTQMRTWDDLTDDDREPYRRITRRMLAAAGVLVEDRQHGTSERDVEADAMRAALDEHREH